MVVTNPSPGGGPSSASMFTVLSSYLSVNIIDLPRGALADVTVTGPDGLTLSLTASQTIPNPEGTFARAANGVAVGSSRYYATKPSQSVTVAAGSATTVTVDYYDIIPNTTKVLDPTGMQSLAVSSDDGSTLTISSESAVAASLEAGNILATAPTTAAPNGLLNKVQQVTTSGSNVVVNVTPATLADAVQQAKFTFNQAIAPSNAMTAKKVLPGVRILQKPTAPINVLFTIAILVALAGLSYYSLAKDRDNPEHQKAIAVEKEQAVRVCELIRHNEGIPPAGAFSLLRKDPKTQGPRLFTQNCASCHDHAGNDPLADIKAEKSSAPNLAAYASRRWLAGLFDPKRINGPDYFGNTKLRGGKMAGFVKDTFSDLDADQKKNLEKVIMAVSAEAELPSQRRPGR